MITPRWLVLPLVTLVAGCAFHWRENASSDALRCPSGEVTITDKTSGAITNTWKAHCRGRTMNCSVPADADPLTVATCVPDPSSPPPPEDAVAPGTQEKLDALKRAHDLGVLTDDEYESKRRAVIDAR